MDAEIADKTQRKYSLHSSQQCLILLVAVLALYIICSSILVYLLLTHKDGVKVFEELVKLFHASKLHEPQATGPHNFYKGGTQPSTPSVSATVH